MKAMTFKIERVYYIQSCLNEFFEATKMAGLDYACVISGAVYFSS